MEEGENAVFKGGGKLRFGPEKKKKVILR